MLVTSLTAGVWCGWSASAAAFSEPKSYLDDAAKGGGGGRWFTGSPAEGYGCSVCHTAAPGQAQYPLHAEGFPSAGYIPGQSYDIRLSWPEFAARDQQVRSVMNAEPTSMGLIAEFVAESGIGSGMVELLRKGMGEPCVFPPNSASSLIYQVAPGAKALEVSRCEANSLGERCVITVGACGSQELTIHWTAPPQPQDSVWFAAGFVATDRISRNPESDSVTEIAGPMRPIGSGSTQYESALNGGCSVGPRAPSLRFPGWLAALAILALVRLRRRRRRVVTAHFVSALGASAIALCCACSEDPVAEPQSTHSSLLGLYSPGNALGASTPVAGSGGAQTTEAEINGYFAVPAGNRCEGVPEATGTKGGTLSIEFQTVPLHQMWGPANIGAIWIEDSTPAQHYIKTLELWADVRRKALYKYGRRACQMAEPDVVSRATLPMPAAHKVMWNGKDLQGHVVPDGLYKLFIEVTETEANIGSAVTYDFPKGPMPVMLQPPDAEPHQGLKVTYTPMP